MQRLNGRGATLSGRALALRSIAPALAQDGKPSSRLTWITRAYFKGSRRRLKRFLSAFDIPLERAEELVLPANFVSVQADGSPASNDDGKGCQFPAEDFADGTLRDAVFTVCGPVLSRGYQQICSALAIPATAEHFKDGVAIAHDAMLYIISKLWALTGPAIAVEYNLFAMQTGNAQNGAQSLGHYLAVTRTPSYRNRLLEKYPVLADGIETVGTATAEAIVEIISRLASDTGELHEFFGVPAQEKIGAIRYGLGDTHNSGRSVCFVTFETRQIVYKPRSLAPELLFNSFVEWLSSKDADIAIRRLKVLSRDTYGYTEFVTHAPAQSAADTSLFYRRLGSLLVVTWVLGISDLHFENLIADGPEPMVIDLESILQRPLQTRDGEAAFSDLYNRAFCDLLFHSLLLPLKVATADGVMDMSAIGTPGTPAAMGKYLAFEAGGDGRIGFVERAGVSQGENRPSMPAGAHEPFAHLTAILSGYDLTARTVLAHIGELRGEAFVRSLEGISSRWVPRATRTYSELLVSMRHPSVLTDAIERDFLAASLWQDTDRRPVMEAIICSELHDMQRGDVPYFSSCSSSRDLRDSEDNSFTEVFACSGVEAFLARLDSLSGVQASHRLAITTALESTRPGPTLPAAVIMETHIAKTFDRHKALEYAAGIGQQLSDAVHFVDDIPFWSGFQEVSQQNYGATVLMPTIYDGSLGIGLFITRLHRLQPRPVWGRIVQGTHQLTELLLNDTPGQTAGNAFTGFAGVLFANLATSAALGVPPQAFSKKLDQAFAKWSKREANCDFVAGLAGAMVVLMRYHDAVKSDLALKRMLAIRQIIVRRAEWVGDHCSWRSPMFENPLGGFAHGSAGIAWALAATQKLAHDPEIDTAVDGALRHDDTFYRPDLGMWSDGRNGELSNYWCHGAAGIGLAAHGIDAMLTNALAQDIRSRAHRAVASQGPLMDDCLCHGTLGNAELFRAMGDDKNLQRFYEMACAKYLSSGKWACVSLGSAQLSSLLCGLSGIGYQLLRFADPEVVPNLLMLETGNS